MNILKTILFILTLLSTSLAHAQTRLDDLQLDLPTPYNWARGMHGFESDSLVRLQTWYVEESIGQKVLVVTIISQVKAGVTEGLGDVKRMISQSPKVTLLDEGKISDGYSYVLFKGPAAEERVNQLGAVLMMVIETETSMHYITVQSEKPKLSDAFVDRWSAILKNPEITPGPSIKLKKQ